MSYIKNVWENGDKVTAKKLNNIENGIEELDNKTKIVEKGFKEFQIGDRFQSGYELTIDNSNGVVPSKTYYFYAYNKNGEYLEAFDLLVSLIKDSPIQFQWGFEATGENFITNAVIFGADPEDISTFISEIAYYELVDSSSVSGSGLLGGYGETQLTLQNVYDNTKVVEKEFKEFELGQTFKIGDKLTKDNVQNTNEGTLDHWFYDTTETYAYVINWNVKKQLFSWSLVRVENDEILDAENHEQFTFGLSLEDTSLTFKLEEAVDEGEGSALLGTWTETQLTAQEVYDSTKFKDNVIYNGQCLIAGHYVSLPELNDGLYELRFESVNFSNYTAIFRISNGMSRGITNICFTNYEGGIVNGGFTVGIIDNDGQEILGVQFYDTLYDETVRPEADAIMTLTRIL